MDKEFRCMDALQYIIQSAKYYYSKNNAIK